MRSQYLRTWGDYDYRPLTLGSYSVPGTFFVFYAPFFMVAYAEKKETIMRCYIYAHFL